MDPGAGSSQESLSVLIPEAPGSPNLLDSPPPRSPQIFEIPWRESTLQHDSDTFTEPTQNQNDGSEASAANIPAPDESNDEGSNSSTAVNLPAPDSESNDGLENVNFPAREQSNEVSSRPTTPYNEDDSCTYTSLPHAEEPPAKIRKISSRSNEDMDGETCPICLDSWGNSGDHRLVALKCGHLFGLQCVERWLKAQPAKDRSCPTCKTKSTVKDIRHIYARRLVAADTSQIITLQKQVDNIQVEKSRVELELQKSRIAHRACMLQLDVLRNTLMKTQPSKELFRKSWRFALEKNMEICKDGACRVSTYNCRTYELYVSQKSQNALFPGYGIRKVSCVDYRLGPFVHLHSKAIRDITYSQPRDLLLSVGLDSTVKIIEKGVLNLSIPSGVPLWSCSWDYLRSNEFYVGGIGGVIHQYDVRNPRMFIERLQPPGDMSPVVSLCSTEFGLLSCQLNSSWLWVSNMRRWEPRSLPIEGPFMSLCYDNDSHRALISCRPGANGERSRLSLCKLRASVPSGEVLVDVENTFLGSAKSTLMSRSTFVRAAGASWVAAHSESDSMLYLHGLDGARTISLLAQEPSLDVCSLEMNGDSILAALSESRLRLYKAVPSNS